MLLRGYRLNAPIEHTVHLAQSWQKDELTGAWHVKLGLDELAHGLGKKK